MSGLFIFVGVVTVLAGVASQDGDTTTAGFGFLLAAIAAALHAVASAISAAVPRMRSDVPRPPPPPPTAGS